MENATFNENNKPIFQDPIYGLYGLMYTEDNFDFLKDTLNEIESEYKNDPWKYIIEIERIYDTFELSHKDNIYANTLLHKNKTEFFSWVNEIQYIGIQLLCLQLVSSLETLTEFVKYVSRYGNNKAYLVIVIIHTFMQKAKKLSDEARCEKNKANTKADMHKIESDINIKVHLFIEAIFDISDKLCDEIVYSMLSNFRCFDRQRNKYDGMLRDAIIEKIVERCMTEDALLSMLQHPCWKEGKVAILHKVFLYAAWSCNHDEPALSCHETLWQELTTIMGLKGMYMHYNQLDDQQLCWLCAKLLADDKEPDNRLRELMPFYQQRNDGWKRDADQQFQNERAIYFFLTVGAMSAEWMQREKKEYLAVKMIKFIYDEWRLPLYHYDHDCEDEVNFLQQFWARYALLAEQIGISYIKKHIVDDFAYIHSPKYRLAVIQTFFRNLKQDVKAKILDDNLVDRIKLMLKKDILLLKSENADFDIFNKKIIKQIENLRLNCM